jgi:hypothetical protein
MKTMKKAILGILFLAPLLLPTTTKAGGGFDEWIHDFFRNNDHRNVRPMPPAYDARNPYRQYDPYHMRGSRPGDAQGADPQGSGNSVPIDGGVVFLLAAGLALGAVKVYHTRKQVIIARLD